MSAFVFATTAVEQRRLARKALNGALADQRIDAICTPRAARLIDALAARVAARAARARLDGRLFVVGDCRAVGHLRREAFAVVVVIRFALTILEKAADAALLTKRAAVFFDAIAARHNVFARFARTAFGTRTASVRRAVLIRSITAQFAAVSRQTCRAIVVMHRTRVWHAARRVLLRLWHARAAVVVWLAAFEQTAPRRAPFAL